MVEFEYVHLTDSTAPTVLPRPKPRIGKVLSLLLTVPQQEEGHVCSNSEPQEPIHTLTHIDKYNLMIFALTEVSECVVNQFQLS